MDDDLRVTAEWLARALWGPDGFEALNGGFYAGTRVPLRRVPADAVVVVSEAGHYPHELTDAVGGWIAERFSTFDPQPRLGAREYRRVRRSRKMTYRVEKHDHDGRGDRRVRVYPVPSVDPSDFWASVTDIACPACGDGPVCWAEAGYVPGYRICAACGRHFLAQGTAAAPTLHLLAGRRD